jgi:hypothetical protein
VTLSIPPPTQELVTDDRSITTPWYRYWTQANSQINATDLRYVKVTDYGATGNGTTDDTLAISRAFTAAQAENKALLFPADYTFLMSTLTVTGNNWHIIIERGCTVKLKGDGGVQNTTGIFNISGNNGRISNFGTISGNRSAQTYASYGSSTAAIQSAALSLGNFTYENGGVGAVTNLAFSAVYITQNTGDVLFDGFILTDGCPPNASKALFDRINRPFTIDNPQGSAVIRGARFSGAATFGIAINAGTTPADAHILIDDFVMDWRGVDLVAVGGEPGVGYLGVEAYRYTHACHINNMTVWGEANSVDTTALVEAISHGSSHNLRVFSGTNVNSARGGNVGTGIEVSHFVDTTHTGFILDQCGYGVVTNNNTNEVSARIEGTITNAGYSALWHNSPGHIDANITVIDCGANGGVFTPTIRCTGNVGTLRLKCNALYLDKDENILFLYTETGTVVNLYDSNIINEMATNTSKVRLTIEADDFSISNCDFVGQADQGTCVTATGDSLRIQNSRFDNYDSPWDTSGGTNSILTDNDTRTCASPNGTIDATDFRNGPGLNGTEKLITSGSLGVVASLDTFWTETFSEVRLVARLRPATDDVELDLRVSTDLSVSYDATGYRWYGRISDSNGTFLDSSGTGDTAITVTGVPGATDAVGNAAGEFITVEAICLNPAEAVTTQFLVRSSWSQADGGHASFVGGGVRNAGQDTNGLQLLFESGNITSGNYALYGRY